MRSWWGEGAGFCIALVEAVDIRLYVVDILPAVVDAVVGVACASPLLGSRLFDKCTIAFGPAMLPRPLPRPLFWKRRLFGC